MEEKCCAVLVIIRREALRLRHEALFRGPKGNKTAALGKTKLYLLVDGCDAMDAMDGWMDAPLAHRPSHRFSCIHKIFVE